MLPRTAAKIYIMVLLYMIAHLLLAIRDVRAESFGLDAIEQYERERAARASAFEHELQSRELRNLRNDQWYDSEMDRIQRQREKDLDWFYSK